MNNIPFYANIDEETGSIFDGEMLSHLSYYFLLCALSLYIGATEANLQIEEENEIDDFNTSNEEEPELAIIEGRKETMLDEVCNLLTVYAKNFQKYKKSIITNKGLY